LDKQYGVERDPLAQQMNPGLRDPVSGDPIDRTELTATEARQGGTGRPVLYVLVAALILGALYIMGSAFYSNDAVDTEAGRIASTQSNEATAPTTPPPAATTPPAAATPPATSNPPAGDTGPNMKPIQ
jgi:hypothetical protein